MVVLHKIDVEAGEFRETAAIEALEEKAARIAVHGRFDHEHAGDAGFDRAHLQNSRDSSPSR